MVQDPPHRQSRILAGLVSAGHLVCCGLPGGPKGPRVVVLDVGRHMAQI